MKTDIHFHNGYEIIYIVTGKGKIIIDGESYDIDPPMICVIPTKMTHGIIIEKEVDYERYTLNISEPLLDRFFEKYFSEKTRMVLTHNREVYYIGDEIYNESGLLIDLFSDMQVVNYKREKYRDYLVILLFGYLVYKNNKVLSLGVLLKCISEDFVRLHYMYYKEKRAEYYTDRHLNRISKSYYNMTVKKIERLARDEKLTNIDCKERLYFL